MKNRHENPNTGPVKSREFLDEEIAERQWFLDYLRNLKEKIESGELTPTAEWDVVWVISGPELTLDDADAEDGIVNQTKERMETGFTIVKQVTALRLQKDILDVTRDDIRSNGPRLYYNGGEGRTLAFQKLITEGIIEKQYGIPTEILKLTENDSTIKHTGHQFDEFPEDLEQTARNIVAVSSWYHCPRIQKYIEKKAHVEGKEGLLQQMIVYPADINRLRVGRAVGEAKKTWDYFEGTEKNNSLRQRSL